MPMPEKKGMRKPVTREDLDRSKMQVNKDQARYEVMKNDFESFRASREEDFKKNIKSIVSEEDMDAIELGGDPLKIYEIIKKYEQEYISDKIEEKREDLEAFEEQLHKNTALVEQLEIEAQFLEENPDLDFEGLIDLLESGLSPKEKQTLMEASGGDSMEFLKLAKERLGGAAKGDTGKEKEEDPMRLPTDLSFAAGETGDVDGGTEGQDDNEYLASIGLA
ncbi:MAG TPA: hypothetical protein CFH81_08775 [Sulfurovum sp. UBA12169]|nr:MAG TPA: hypothetical protein CFH81_08775 [Sulfurovum sp. UBA12169]